MPQGFILSCDFSVDSYENDPQFETGGFPLKISHRRMAGVSDINRRLAEGQIFVLEAEIFADSTFLANSLRGKLGPAEPTTTPAGLSGV